jgi:hypothetical protein
MKVKTYPRIRVAKVEGRWYLLRVYGEGLDRRSSEELRSPYATGFYYWTTARDMAFNHFEAWI